MAPGASSCRIAGKVETGSRGHLLLASAVALVLLGAATGDPPKATGFTLAAHSLAKCLDGSPGRYYFRPAAAEADVERWLM